MRIRRAHRDRVRVPRVVEENAAARERDLLVAHVREGDVEAIRNGRGELDPAAIRAFLEVHIEQAPTLVEAGLSLAICSGIPGNFRYPQARIVFTGGSGRLVPNASSEADVAVRLLESLGVTADRIIAGSSPRCTKEGARTWQRAGLVVPSLTIYIDSSPRGDSTA